MSFTGKLLRSAYKLNRVKRAVTNPSRYALRAVDSKTSTTGVLITTYERAGDIRYCSFAVEEPTQAELERRGRMAEG
jgi:hypothetical protein